MASLTGQLVAETYKALLKLIDNDILTASEKQITDGFGGGSNVFIDSQGFLRANKYKITNGLATQFLKADGSLDSNAYLTSITGTQVITALGYTPVPTTRTITINGETHNLAADNSWTIGGTAAIWGNITGTLSNQTDLQNALNAKYNNPTGTISQYIRGDGSIANFPALTGYVPYSGATSNVNLGEYGITSGFVGFDTTPTGTPTGIGTLYWDSANRTLSLIDGDGDTTLQIGQEERVLVHNNTGATLTDGQIVYVTGSTGELPSVALASNSAEATSSVTFGMVTESIAHGADGFITTSGIVHGLNTLAFTEGAALWLGTTPGTFTQTKPVAPLNSVLVGYVIKKAGGNGSVFVKIQNGYELEELHDVYIADPANNHGLFYDIADGLWKNKSIVSALGYTPQAQLSGTGFVKASGTTITYDNSTYLTTADAESTYQRLDKMVLNLLPSATEYPNSNAVINALALKADAANPVFTGNMTISGAEPKLYFTDTDQNPDYFIGVDAGFFRVYDQTAGATRFVINSDGNISTGVGKSITAGSFIKDGGTATQFLKADGSVDSTDYATVASLANYLLSATAASTYQTLANLSTDLTTSATKYPSVNAVNAGLATKQPLDADLTAIAGLTGTSGFLKKTAADTWTLDTSTYLTTGDASTTYLAITTAASTYQRLDKMVSNLLPSSTEYPNSNAVINALALKADAANPVFTGNMTISGATPRLYFVDTDQNPDYTVFIDSGYFYIYDQTAGATRFSINSSGNINTGVGKSITAGSFIKESGTSSQYLMADGSVSTGPSLSGYVPYTGATANVDLGTRSLSSSLLFVNPVTSLASGAVIRTYNFGDPNWGFSNTQAAGANSDQYHVRVHGSGGTYGYLRQFQVIDASQSNNVRFAVNFDGSGAIFSSGLGLGGNMPTADRQFYISGTSFTSGTSQYQAVINTTFVNAATQIFGLYLNNNTNANVTTSYALFMPATGGTGTIGTKWAIYQSGGSDNNYFAGKVLVNTNTDAGYLLDVNGLARVKTLFPSYAASTLANQNSGIIWTNGTIGNAFGFVVQSGLFFQGDANASNNVFGVKAPTSDGSLGSTVFSILSNGIVNSRGAVSSAGLGQPAYFGNGEFMATGSYAGYFWENRSGGVTSNSNWYGWYTTGGIVNLFNGSSNILSINGTSGATTFISSVSAAGLTSTGDGLINGGLYLGGANSVQSTDKPHIFRISGGGLGISANNESAGNQPIYFYTAGAIRLTISGNGTSTFSNTVISNDQFRVLAYGNYRLNNDANGLMGYLIRSGAWKGNAENNIALATDGPYGISFFTNGTTTERFHVTSGGNIILNNGTTDNGKRLQVNGNASLTGGIYVTGSSYNFPNAVVMANDENWTYGIYNDGGVQYWMQVKYYGVGDDNRGFRVLNVNGNTIDFRVNGSGNGYFRGASYATSFYESSDIRLKTLIESNPIIEGIENLQAKLYEKDGKIELGYFAQDAELIMPYAVTKNADGFLNLSYREVHTAKIARLEKEVAELKAQLNLN